MRPQRLLILLATVVTVVLISSFFSVTSFNSSKHIRTRLRQLPSYLRNQVCLSSPYTEDQTYNALAKNASVYSIGRYAIKDEQGNYRPPEFNAATVNQAPRAKAAFIALVRNDELEGMVQSMQECTCLRTSLHHTDISVEFRFNRKYNYPWVFLNDKPFTNQFKREVRKHTRAPIYFGEVPKEHWSYPDWIDQFKAFEGRIEMMKLGAPYAGSESYRHMCRWQSGFFFEHPLTYQLDLEYYWRVEPNVHLTCDIDYDPFMFMKINNKAYGFTIAMVEIDTTIPTLWQTTLDFVKKHPDYLAPDNAQYFIIDDDSLENSSYNMCHFWSNFEIGDLRFFRSKQYKDYFKHLDDSGGFFYERWGDAPVHSIAASLFLNRTQVYHFKDIGYSHGGMGHCPLGEEKYHQSGKCDCNPLEAITITEGFCMGDWWFASAEGRPPERKEYEDLIRLMEAQSNEEESEEMSEQEESGD